MEHNHPNSLRLDHAIVIRVRSLRKSSDLLRWASKAILEIRLSRSIQRPYVRRIFLISSAVGFLAMAPPSTSQVASPLCVPVGIFLFMCACSTSARMTNCARANAEANGHANPSRKPSARQSIARTEIHQLHVGPSAFHRGRPFSCRTVAMSLF